MTPRKILIVDDDYAFAKYAKMLLELMGYQAVALTDGLKAPDTAASERPDLILIDMSMEDTTGTDAIRSLKAKPETKNIPIVLCSMSKNRSEVEEAFAVGAVDFLPKPLKREQLKEMIAKTLGSA